MMRDESYAIIGREPGSKGSLWLDEAHLDGWYSGPVIANSRENELHHFETLETIADDPKEPTNARISAIGMLLDRARGKASQPHDVHASGQITLQVISGVPEDETSWCNARGRGVTRMMMYRPFRW